VGIDMIRSRTAFALTVLLVCSGPAAVRADAGPAAVKPGWKPEAAGKYLDERQEVWFGYARCVSCHSGLPYALARPALRKLVGARTPSAQETRLLAQIKRRGANWVKLDTKEFGLYYDASAELKKQSWGTEAVFNAAILAFDDRYRDRSSPSAATRQAFAHLWQTQRTAGDRKGSWEWLDFGEPPWGSKEARYVGAALAAIAVGTAPGYHTAGADADAEAGVRLLRGYLKDQFPRQNLHNRIWGLWAATQLEGILTRAEQKETSDRLLARQQADGGWSLLALGPWERSSGSARQDASDGYATALILHVLQTAGLSKDHEKVARGLDWLKRNQAVTGAWPSASLIKKRDPASHVGKFMSDAATAFAVLALSHGTK
jgi:squalene-hopene/tetraprenyl-beta-curcumene cyclase